MGRRKPRNNETTLPLSRFRSKGLRTKALRHGREKRYPSRLPPVFIFEPSLNANGSEWDPKREGDGRENKSPSRPPTPVNKGVPRENGREGGKKHPVNKKQGYD